MYLPVKKLDERDIEDIVLEQLDCVDGVIFNDQVRKLCLELKKFRKAANKKIKESSADALLFYENYPRKQGGKKALIAFDALTKEKQKLALDDNTAERYADREKQFIPHPTTYLHGEFWNDEVINNGTSQQSSTDKFLENLRNAGSD